MGPDHDVHALGVRIPDARPRPTGAGRAASTLGWFGPQLFFQLERDGPRNDRWIYCTAAQRRAVRRLLEHIIDTRAELIEEHWNAENEAFRALRLWSEEG